MVSYAAIIAVECKIVKTRPGQNRFKLFTDNAEPSDVFKSTLSCLVHEHSEHTSDLLNHASVTKLTVGYSERYHTVVSTYRIILCYILTQNRD